MPARSCGGDRCTLSPGLVILPVFLPSLPQWDSEFSPHPFPDHHAYAVQDFSFALGGVLLMTEKDAVKCSGLALPEAWVLPVEAQIDDAPFGRSLLETILERLNGRTLARYPRLPRLQS